MEETVKKNFNANFILMVELRGKHGKIDVLNYCINRGRGFARDFISDFIRCYVHCTIVRV